MSNSETNSTGTVAQIGKLDGQGKNFAIWKLKLLGCLESLDLIEVIEKPLVSAPKSRMSLGTPARSSSHDNNSGDPLAARDPNEEHKNTAQKVLENKAKKAYAIFMMTLSDDVLNLVMHIPRGNAHEVWNTILQEFESKTTASKSHTRAMLHKCKMGNNENFSTYRSRITQIVLSLEAMGETVSNGELMFVLANGLPAAYEPLVQTLQVNDKMNFQEACTHLKEYQEKMLLQKKFNPGTSNSETANYGADLTEDSLIEEQEELEESSNNNNQETAHYISYGLQRSGLANQFRGASSHRGRFPFKARGSGRGGGRNTSNNNNNYNSNQGSKYCYICKMNNHSTDDCSFNSKGKKQTEATRQNNSKHNGSGSAYGPENVKCFYCGKRGHYARECTNPKKSGEENNKEGSEYGMHAQDKEFTGYVAEKVWLSQPPAETAAIAAVTVNNNNNHKNNNNHNNLSSQWILDSGCTSHYANNINLLQNIKEISAPITVAVANNQTVDVNKCGESLIKAKEKIRLTNVRYSEEFSNNLLSIAKLADRGATIIFEPYMKGATVTYKGTVAARAKRVGNLYYVESTCEDYPAHEVANIGKESASVSANENSSCNGIYNLLHARLGHLSQSGIKGLIDRNALRYIMEQGKKIDFNINRPICEGCEFGKSHRQPFKDYTSRPPATALLERIHCDLSGPINISEVMGEDSEKVFKCLGEPKYLSLIVDEKSRMMFCKLLQFKSEAADHIIEFITQAENEVERKVKYFHADGGTEYNNSTLREYFKSKGIKMELTTRSTPQHNGIVERCNRSVFELARSMLFHAKLNSVFWGEAVKTAVYLLNYRLAINDKDLSHTSRNMVWYQTQHSTFKGIWL